MHTPSGSMRLGRANPAPGHGVSQRARRRVGASDDAEPIGRELYNNPFTPGSVQLFNFQWLARPRAASIFLLFTYGSRRRLFINQVFFEQC